MVWTSYFAAESSNSTLPALTFAPPIQVLVKGLSLHTARAALNILPIYLS